MNLTAWDSIKLKKRNPALSSGHIVLEFDRTKKQKIFAHKLGRINFKSKNINPSRDEVIQIQKGNIDINGFIYKNIGHTYIDSQIIEKNSTLGGFPIYAHGHPLGGTEHAGMESCIRDGLICANGEGTNELCNPGKCIIGVLSFIRNKKWKYQSINKYEEVGSNSGNTFPLEYYINGDKEADLKTLRRGTIKSFSTNSSKTLKIDAPASNYSKIYLPPKYYFSEDFIELALKVIDERLDFVNKKPLNNIIGIEDRKSRFISSFITSLYPGKTQSEITNILYEDGVRKEVKYNILEIFSSLPNEWYNRCEDIIEEEYLYREARIYDNYKFISIVYDRVVDLFGSIIQVSGSSFRSAKLNYNRDSIARPVYSRLPGISEGYRYDPLFSEKESPAKWLTSGIDDFLSSKKDQIGSFYKEYLDPDTCSPLTLDWLAQHVGLTGNLWDSRWNRNIKTALIKNSFGWFDRELSSNIPGIGKVLTPKGETLSEFPFASSPVWVEELDSNEWDSINNWQVVLQWGGDIGNLTKLKLDEIESIKINNKGDIISNKDFKINSYSTTTNTLSLIDIDTPKVNKKTWNGLMESKGSILSSIFLSTVFDLKSHTPLELEVVDTKNKIIKPRDGLRNTEINSPVLMPYKTELIQTGDTNDIKIRNFPNQMIAGISKVSTLEDVKNVFFRVPYYYNKNGKSWDRVKYIVDNWLPDNLNKRVQYAYLSADLWTVGDGFFEPEIAVGE